MELSLSFSMNFIFDDEDVYRQHDVPAPAAHEMIWVTTHSLRGSAVDLMNEN